ncbi:hypothetical protein B7H23_01325 [Notoacmeibacter marinus]|uniref:IrrE N-terminal-like domain-containing protein n=1 Tax=Notoacmeibacter marinus TaxID=1876515 RepID=A0A231V0S7_9HYPH|nr:ImmA/IrrE family metallo-endopeptidase [Notoacmeibacter marinus]OXT01641.1 hypothetical protein B7H23_01325 [Notoacmeibacter marinus]
MGKFRLTMACQLGEKIAEEAGYREFPVEPLAIAQSKEITVQAKPSDVKGISGALIFAGNDATLIYSNEYDNLGFENFCIAHELGHYCLPGHPEEIIQQGGTHLSRAGFTQNSSIELEADHFASGLLLPTGLTRQFLGETQIGLQGIIQLAEKAQCSRTAAAIRAAECSPYPMAVIVSQGNEIAYAFLSEAFKNLGKLSYLRKGSPLPESATLNFNGVPENVFAVRQQCAETNLKIWFDGMAGIKLDEEILGLGKYGYTLTVLSSDELADDPYEEDDEEAELEKTWTPRFAYGR